MQQPQPNAVMMPAYCDERSVTKHEECTVFFDGTEIKVFYTLNNHRLKPVGLNNGLKVRIRVG